MAHPLKIVQARTPRELELARELFREYAAAIGIDLCFQGFDEELASLPGKYAEPQGRLLLCFEQNSAVGCGALRPLRDDIAEMKRLYIRPTARRRGFAKLLGQKLIDAAREIGYRAVVLDTLRSMIEARALYSSLGFAEIAAYYPNPLPDVCYMRLDLAAGSTRIK